jgi:hypothetical protein
VKCLIYSNASEILHVETRHLAGHFGVEFAFLSIAIADL